MSHQSAAVAKLAPSRVGALFMEMGTGKSLTVLELAKIRQARWSRLFWFCPCALRPTVFDQILEHTDISREQIAVWDDAGMRRRNDGALVHIIGIETMSSSDAAVLRYASLVNDTAYVVVDESTYIKSNRAKRTERITRMSERCRYRTILTGTPLTQGITDVYSQMQFLSPQILGYRSFYSFARDHLEYATRESDYGSRRRVRTGQIVRTFNEDLLAAKIEPYVYQVRKDECLDLPEKIHLDRWCDLSADQVYEYNQAKERVLKTDPDDWTRGHILRLFSDLQKITCGIIGNAAGGYEHLENNRIDLLLEVIGELPPDEPVIIWSKYLEVATTIRQALERAFDGRPVFEFSGNVPPGRRQAQIDGWRKHGGFFVATQSMGGHGLTLNEAAYSIFYADSFKFSDRLQSEDRNHRIGQSRRTTYISIGCRKSIDERIARALAHKGDTLEEFMTLVDEVKDGDAASSEKLADAIREL